MCLYFPGRNRWVYLSTHVDDIFPLYNPQGRLLRDKIFQALSQKVTVENKGDLSWALSTKIERDPVRGLVKISQEENVNDILRSHGLGDIGEEDTPHADKGGDAKLTEEDLP